MKGNFGRQSRQVPQATASLKASSKMPKLNNSSNTDFEPVADWITTDYIQNALRKYKKDENLQVVDVVYTPATAKGENYASVMVRARVKYLCKNDSEPREDRFILKMPFEDHKYAYEIDQYQVYNKEVDIYENVLPKLVEILREAGDDEKLFADTIFVDYDHSAIIFEDLSVKSYVLADRLEGLDMEHAKMVLRKLAKMHATSAVLEERSPGLLRKFDRGMMNRHTDAFRNFFEGNLVACGQAACQWGDDYKKYGEKLLKMRPMFMEHGKRVFDVKENYFNALAHGDLWVNNVMFRYDSADKKNPADGLMIDFQFTCWGSPAIDLHYYFNTSLREELRLHHQEELVQYYHSVLVDMLGKLGFKGHIPSLHEFWIQITEKSFYALSAAVINQPVMLNDKTENADIDSFMGSDERALAFKRTIYENEKVQKNLKRLLPVFDRRGLLDIV